MKQKLRFILTRQWLTFSALFIALFIAVMFFFMFIFEDKANEQTVVAVANMISQQQNLLPLPENFNLYPVAKTPADLQDLVGKLALNSAEEYERYHLIKFFHPAYQSDFVLTYNTAQVDSVWRAADKILLLLSPLILLVLFVSYWLAKSFTNSIANNLDELLLNTQQSYTPENLKAFAKAQYITEFADMAVKHADIWQQQLDLIDKEKQMLTYLSHELRTPMQVIQSSTELIGLNQQNVKALERLQRANLRLSRVSTSILWLMKGRDVSTDERVSIGELGQQLVDEFQILANKKNQKIQLEATSPLYFYLPLDVMEVLLSNLMLNAVQHGAAGKILLRVKEDKVVITNAIAENQQTAGFGIGMELALKLAEQFSLSLTYQVLEGNHPPLMKVTLKSDKPI